MRQLHFVGVTDDHRGLILADRQDTAGARYTISVDEALLGVLDEIRRVRRPRPLRPLRPEEVVTGNGAVPADHRPTFPGGRPSFGSLTPREMQARLRSGRSVADVAREAGVDDAWVERFAAPILAEQHAAVERAGAMIFHTSRRGPSARPLGESVRRNLLERGVRLVEDDLAACWSAFLHDGSEWVVRFVYRYRGREVEAEWLADFQAGSVVAINRPATILGYVAPPPADGPDLAAIDLTVRHATAGRPGDAGDPVPRALAPPSAAPRRPQSPPTPPPHSPPAPAEREVVLRAAASTQTAPRTASSRLPDGTAPAAPARARRAASPPAVPAKPKLVSPKAAPTKAAPTKAASTKAAPTKTARRKTTTVLPVGETVKGSTAKKATGTPKRAARKAVGKPDDAKVAPGGQHPVVGEAPTPPAPAPHTPPLF